MPHTSHGIKNDTCMYRVFLYNSPFLLPLHEKGRARQAYYKSGRRLH